MSSNNGLERRARLVILAALILLGLGALLVCVLDQPERKITWDAFWVLQVSGGSSNNYSRYTREQCLEARAQTRFEATCIPVPLKDATAKPHGH